MASNTSSAAPPSADQPTVDINSVLKKILTHLYLSPFCLEFRRPVRVLHPNLFASYNREVKNPLDLGTVLFNVINGVYAHYDTVQLCSRDLALIFQNSIDFNRRALDMKNISVHLLTYAQNMWEECMCGPFRDMNMEPRVFHERRLDRRAERFAYVRTAPLYEHDKLDFVTIFAKNVPSSPTRLNNALNMSMALCRQRLQEGGVISLSELLWPLVQQVAEGAQPQSQEGGNVAKRLPKSMETELFFYLEATKDPRYSLDNILNGVDKDTLYFLVDLDNRLGELTCHLAERKTRGYSLSAVWAHPSRFVWAQPKKSPWWPGMLLAGADTPENLADINIRRLPKEIKRELIKLRPKPKGGSAAAPVTQEDEISGEIDDPNGVVPAGLVVPPDYCLVEFFGISHDFGWVKTEDILPFPPDGSFPRNDLSPAARPELCTNERCIDEAVEAIGTLEAAVSVGRDSDAVMPTMEQLEADSVPFVFQTPSEPKPPKKRAKKSIEGGDEAKPKRQTKKQRLAEEGKPAPRAEPGMRFKSLDKLQPYELEVRSEVKKKCLGDIHLVAMYLRSVEAVGATPSRHSVPPPPANGVPLPSFVTGSVHSDSENQTFKTPRVYTCAKAGATSRKSISVPAVSEAAEMTENVAKSRKSAVSGTGGAKRGPKLAQSPAPPSNASHTNTTGGETGGEVAAPKKKRRRRSGAKSTGGGDNVGSSKPASARSGKRIQWRQSQLLNFAKLRADNEMDIPNLVAPSPDANGVNQLSEAAMHRNWATTLSTLSHKLKLSCSRLYYGEGVLHSVDVDLNADVFNLESKSRNERKELLRAELSKLQSDISRMAMATNAVPVV